MSGWLMCRPLAAPLLLLLLLALGGCRSAPEPIPDPPQVPAPPPVTWGAENPAGRIDAESAGAMAPRDRGEALAQLAVKLLGSPYRFGGATPSGFDCSGLVFYAHRELGLAVPRTSRDQAREADEIPARKLERGDLVFFRIGKRHVDHVGIYIGDRLFIHAPRSGRPVTLQSLDDEYYEKHFFGAGRFWEHAAQ
jgi:cell wall-associated NlpC family hydrolase